MLSNSEDFIKNSLMNIHYRQEIIGIDNFLDNLESHYFSSVKINNISATLDSLNLVLEINCKLELLEVLSHFNRERWGNNGKTVNPLQQCLEFLNSKNTKIIDIEELTISLIDTSIIIKRLYKNSIASQLNFILKEIAGNYVYLTRGVTQRPYEIFMPIFEVTSENSYLNDTVQTNVAPKSYAEFWGIYLDQEDEACIYDVKKNEYISRDLELFFTDLL